MLQVNFIMIYVIHKILALLKITKNLKRFLRSIIDFYFFKSIKFFFTTYDDEKSRLEEDKNIKENIIKEVRNLFRLKNLEKERNDFAVNGMRNLFRLKNENKAIKDMIIRDIRNLFDHEEKDYYNPVIVCNFWSKIKLNIKIKVIENHYQLKNILIKLDHT